MGGLSSQIDEARRTLLLAGPIIVGQVSQMVMGVTDSVMIGRVGKVPLAASAFANSVFGFAFIIGVGLLIPVAVLVSRAHGANEHREAGEWLRHGAWLAAIVSLLGTGCLLALGAMFHRFGQPTEVLAVVHPYYELISWSLLPTLLTQVFRQYSESLGHAVAPMVTTVASVLLNVVLNWILIYGNLGAPALGLAGAGWATLAARIAGLLALVAWLIGCGRFKQDWPVNWMRRLSRERFRAMLDLGIPAAACLMFEGGAFSAAAILMGWLGATELAAHQIALSCAAFTFMFPLGVSMAVSMRVGKAVGQRQTNEVRTIGSSALWMGAAMMGTFATVFAIGGTWIASLFVQEPEVIRLAAMLLVVAALFQLADGSQVIASGALRGLADVKVPTVITGFAYWVVALPLAWWLGFKTDLGAIGVWSALATGLAIAALALIVRFLHKSRSNPNIAAPDTLTPA
ncbi:MATE family efflux transporter [Opitutales bacterium ASA1]|nr:MATE family efflux transporter [Opitutales bacterium ASA1]